MPGKHLLKIKGYFWQENKEKDFTYETYRKKQMEILNLYSLYPEKANAWDLEQTQKYNERKGHIMFIMSHWGMCISFK